MRISGVVAAIATPIGADGAPDHARFIRLANYLLANGCNALNVLGTTGEATSFTVPQRMALMSAAASDLPLDRMMVGTGAAAVEDAAQLTAHAGKLGFAGALVLPPFYYKDVADEGIAAYFAAIVEASRAAPVPLYLYNFPAMTGVPYTPALVRTLLGRFGERIVGLKDSSGDLDYARRIAGENPGFDVFPSSEAVLLEARSGVFAGCISATANLNSDLCRLAFDGGDQRAHAAAVAIRNLFSGRPLIPGIKALLGHIHADQRLGATKPPLSALAGAAQAELIGLYEQARATALDGS